MPLCSPAAAAAPESRGPRPRGEPPRGDQRPDAFEQQETPLPLEVGQDGEHRRADEVQAEVPPRLLGQHAELRQGEAGEDGKRTRDLDELKHETTSFDWSVVFA
jgi:hypothetical protein